jgi:hypothetical protein
VQVQPLPRFGVFPVFQEPGKGERASVFHRDRERQLRLSRFAPFVKSVRRNQAAPFAECLPKRGRFIDCLSSRIDGLVSDLWILRPIWNQSPLQRIERSNHNLAITAMVMVPNCPGNVMLPRTWVVPCHVKPRYVRDVSKIVR